MESSDERLKNFTSVSQAPAWDDIFGPVERGSQAGAWEPENNV